MKADELIESLRDALMTHKECKQAATMLERFVALADDEDAKAPLFKSPPNLDGVQMSERELAAYHLGREHVAKRLREIAHESG